MTVKDLTVFAWHTNAGHSASSGTTKVDYNTTKIYNVYNLRYLHGSYSFNGNGSASYNTVDFYSGSVNHIHGGHIGYGSANYNTLNIFDGNITGTIQGGYNEGRGDAIGNKVNIFGGTINGTVYGGYVHTSGTVADNEINIYNHPDLTNANLYAGYIGGNTDLYGSGNVLKFHTSNIKAKNIGSFDTLDFFYSFGCNRRQNYAFNFDRYKRYRFNQYSNKC